MIALMALWFGRHAGLPSDGGYFYLCPACHQECIEPHINDVLQTLLDQHPFLHRVAGTQESREEREDRENREGREHRESREARRAQVPPDAPLGPLPAA